MQLKRLSFLLLFICGYLTCVQSQTTVLNPQTDKKLLKQFQDAKLVCSSIDGLSFTRYRRFLGYW